jgi:hypothetical protein
MEFNGNHTESVDIFRTEKSRKIHQQFSDEALFNQLSQIFE